MKKTKRHLRQSIKNVLMFIGIVVFMFVACTIDSLAELIANATPTWLAATIIIVSLAVGCGYLCNKVLNFLGE